MFPVPADAKCRGWRRCIIPIEWFNRSNWGGRFTAELKYAGWDGIVIEGASDEPVWINIINDKVKIEKADGGLWGLDIVDSQQEIARRVIPSLRYGEWAELDGGYTTQIPAIACIGLAGENKSRIASIVHGAGSSAAQGGFGGVWGAKKLKAISVIGTGSVPIADPKALMDAGCGSTNSSGMSTIRSIPKWNPGPSCCSTERPAAATRITWTFRSNRRAPPPAPPVPEPAACGWPAGKATKRPAPERFHS